MFDARLRSRGDRLHRPLPPAGRWGTDTKTVPAEVEKAGKRSNTRLYSNTINFDTSIPKGHTSHCKRVVRPRLHPRRWWPPPAHTASCFAKPGPPKHTSIKHCCEGKNDFSFSLQRPSAFFSVSEGQSFTSGGSPQPPAS